MKDNQDRPKREGGNNNGRGGREGTVTTREGTGPRKPK